MTVRLEPMTEEEYKPWLQNAIEAYAEEHIKDGRWTSENALQESAREFQSLLPDGVTTKDSYLFSIHDDSGQNVGFLWFADRGTGYERHAYVYDFLILEPYR